MAALLKTALRDMYRAGEPFTFLMPAAEGIYLPHGFSTVYEQERRYFRGEEELPDGWSARKALPADAADIADMAESELKGRYKVYAKRDQAYYERLIREYESDGGCLMVCEQEGRIVDCLPAVEELPEEEKAAFCKTLDALYWRSKRERQAGFENVARRVREKTEEGSAE